MKSVRIERDQGIVTVVLDRPEAMNALSAALRRELSEAFFTLAEDPEARVAILTGAGRAFCAGLDLKELGAPDAERVDFSGSDLIGALRAFPGPLIAAVNGHAITGGFELALACDILIASSEARFADTHARVGILPGWGLSQKLPRLIGIGRAKELAFSGNFLTATQALEWGLVNRVTTPEELLPTCRALARDMLGSDPDTLRAYKDLIDRGYELDFGDALRYEAELSRRHVRNVTPASIAQRRGAIQQRGRNQSRSAD